MPGLGASTSVIFAPSRAATEVVHRTMDGALSALLKANGVSDATAAKLAEAPFGITSVKQLANAFDSRGEIKSSFADHDRVQVTDLVQITGLKQSWREAEAAVASQLARAA